MRSADRRGLLEQQLESAVHDTAKATIADHMLVPRLAGVDSTHAARRRGQRRWLALLLSAAAVIAAMTATLRFVRAAGEGPASQTFSIGTLSSTPLTPGPASRATQAIPPTSGAGVVRTDFGTLAAVIAGSDGAQYWVNHDPARSLASRYTDSAGRTTVAGAHHKIVGISVSIANAHPQTPISIHTGWGPTGEFVVLVPATAGLDTATCRSYPARAGTCALTGLRFDPPTKFAGVVLNGPALGAQLYAVLPDNVSPIQLSVVFDEGHGHIKSLPDTGAIP